MNKFLKKLRSRRGESFVEILLAILVAAFGCVVVAVLFTASMNLNLRASELDDTYYGALSQMEQMTEGTGSTGGSAVITDENGGTLNVEIETFGNDTNAAYTRPKA